MVRSLPSPAAKGRCTLQHAGAARLRYLVRVAAVRHYIDRVLM